MALSYLLILFIVIGLLSGVGIVSLFAIKNNQFKNIIFYLLAILSIFITYINVTALPSNYLFQRVLACSFGLLAILSVIINIKNPSKFKTAQILVVTSILCNLIQLFLF